MGMSVCECVGHSMSVIGRKFLFRMLAYQLID
jgi:hypothetical protein